MDEKETSGEVARRGAKPGSVSRKLAERAYLILRNSDGYPFFYGTKVQLAEMLAEKYDWSFAAAWRTVAKMHDAGLLVKSPSEWTAAWKLPDGDYSESMLLSAIDKLSNETDKKEATNNGD